MKDYLLALILIIAMAVGCKRRHIEESTRIDTVTVHGAAIVPAFAMPQKTGDTLRMTTEAGPVTITRRADGAYSIGIQSKHTKTETKATELVPTKIKTTIKDKGKEKPKTKTEVSIGEQGRSPFFWFGLGAAVVILIILFFYIRKKTIYRIEL